MRSVRSELSLGASKQSASYLKSLRNHLLKFLKFANAIDNEEWGGAIRIGRWGMVANIINFEVFQLQAGGVINTPYECEIVNSNFV